jgi:hypothetical protein
MGGCHFLLASQTMSTYRPIVVNPSFEGGAEGVEGGLWGGLLLGRV